MIDDRITTWRLLITEAQNAAEDWSSVVKCTLSDNELDTEFDAGFGGSNGKPFTLWTEDRVYFPAVYDGSEWVASAPRNPCDEVTFHVGGE